MLDSGLQQNSKRQKLTIPNPSDSAVQQNSKRQKLTHQERGTSSREVPQSLHQRTRNELVDGALNVDTVRCAKGSIATDGTTDNIEDGVSVVSQSDREKATEGIRNEKDFENLICIEVFSGSGKLTSAIRKLGMRSVAIDRSSQRTSGPVTILDLTKKDDLQYLVKFIESEKDNIILVHLAPPCGTASAARNRRHKALEDAGGAKSSLWDCLHFVGWTRARLHQPIVCMKPHTPLQSCAFAWALQSRWKILRTVCFGTRTQSRSYFNYVLDIAMCLTAA